jgi:hypothetical protein
MTTSRPELVVQGSQNGEGWKTYRFKYKPDDTKEPPPVVAPHQPRLDWRIWFAALSSPRRSRWVFRLSRRLLEDSEGVEALLAHDPFGDEPPEYVRVLRYEWGFSKVEPPGT